MHMAMLLVVAYAPAYVPVSTYVPVFAYVRVLGAPF